MNRPIPLMLLALAIAGLGLLLMILLAPAEAPPEPTAPPSSAPKTRAITSEGPASSAHPPRHDGGPARPELAVPLSPGTPPASSATDADDYGKPAPLGQDDQDDPEDQPDPDPTVWPSTPEGIKGAIAEALPGIRRCYEQALDADPDMAGRIVVGFTIGTTDTASGVGTVLDAGIAKATIEQTTMDDCLLDAMESLQFDPPADGEIEINYPFVFSAE